MRRMMGIGLAAASALALSGCASAVGGATTTTDGRVQVVASTNVYGQIAEAIGGDAVEVTSIIDSAAQDPHAFEPSARDQLAVSRAEVVIENGGGYDPFIDSLVDATGTAAPVITAVDLLDDHSEHEDETADPDETDHADEADHADETAHADETDHADDGHGHVEGLNEHVWYDPHVVGHVAEAIADELTVLRPDDADAFAANLASFQDGVEGLETDLAALETEAGGARIFVTEPVPLYLTDAAGLVNVAPDAFTEAVEEGQDVPPATLLESLDLLGSGDVRAVIVNAQTGGAETMQVTDAAASDGIPVVSFAETLPEGKTYVEWMSENIQALADALVA